MRWLAEVPTSHPEMTASDPFRTLWVCQAGSQAPQSNHSTILSSNSRVDPMRALLNGASWFIAGTQKSRKL